MLESLPMNLSPSRRAATAWMLCLCILSNLAACAIAHGQSSGLQLSGSGLFCSADDHHGASFADDLDSTSASNPFSCALSGSALVCLGLLFALAWLLQPRAGLRPRRALPHRASPRHCWPSANPRASPAH